MFTSSIQQTIDLPLYWINLDRCMERHRKMSAAINIGGWKNSHRWSGVDAIDMKKVFFSYKRPWQESKKLPDLFIKNEINHVRITSRAELACFASWQLLIEYLFSIKDTSEWFLIMEDDLGSSLAIPERWPFDIASLIAQAGPKALAIQLAPINGEVRRKLYQIWSDTKGDCLVVPKNLFRSHGNGAVLLHQNSLPFLKRHLGYLTQKFLPNLHLLGHPKNVRPVADKWLYACLDPGECFLATFPLFCLEAKNSLIHQDHVSTFHAASRDMTLALWETGKHYDFISSFYAWEKTT